MKKILVVGFGAMGCRHVQSLMGAGKNYQVHIAEPSQETRTNNCTRIGATEDQFTWHTDLSTIDDQYDLAVIATSSGPRFAIMQELLRKNILFFLVEKIVFQSAEQFATITGQLEAKGAKAYCNFTSRYFNAYNQVKDSGIAQPFSMTVHGGDFGLGCNAIHYIDVFQYLAGDRRDIKLESASVNILPGENRRGSQYGEFTGMMHFTDGGKNLLTVIADHGYGGGVTIHLRSGSDIWILNEQSGKIFHANGSRTSIEDYTILPTSRLTATIAEEIWSGSCRLSEIKDTEGAHLALFGVFNKVLNIEAGAICPIT